MVEERFSMKRRKTGAITVGESQKTLNEAIITLSKYIIAIDFASSSDCLECGAKFRPRSNLSYYNQITIASLIENRLSLTENHLSFIASMML